MAVLQKIRSRAGLLIGLLGLALLAFIFSDLFTSSNAFLRKFKDNVFSVDGTVVTTSEYRERLQEYDAFRSFLSGQSSNEGNQDLQNRETVYREMVDEMVILQEAEKLGLAVTADEMSDLFYGSNPSSLFYYDKEIAQMFRDPQTGQFNQAFLINFLTMMRNGSPVAEEQAYLDRAKSVWPYIEKRVKIQRLKEKYAALVGATTFANSDEVKIAYEDAKTNANFAYVVQPYTSLSDSSVTVSESEMKALYDKRKNNFKLQSEISTISYFIKDVIPSDADYAVVRKEMVTAAKKLSESDDMLGVLNEYSAQYVDAFVSPAFLSAEARNFIESANVGDVLGPITIGQDLLAIKYVDKTVAPDSVHLQRIAIPEMFDKKMVDNIADSLLNVIKKGKSFASVANEIDPSAQDGYIGWLTEAQLASIDINKPVFAAKQGEIVKLNVRGETWLVRVAERTKPVKKVKIAAISMPVIISERTLNSIDNELNQFISENGNVDKFDQSAKTKGYGLVSDAMIAPSFIGLDQADGTTNNIISWAFNNETGKVAKFDYPDKKIVAIIKSRVDDDYVPFSEPSLKKILKDELIRDKKAEKIIADLKSKNLTTLDAYAQAMDAKEETVDYVSFDTRQLSFGYEPLFNVYAKHGAVDQLAAPLKGEDGVYAIKVTAKAEDTKEFNAEQIKMRLNQEISYQMRQGAIFVLRDKMDVKDNRIKF
ncbi:peptidylprolyl isomerase [Dysgonomonas sp. 25]|uniref:peptidylprolyl isomerase n=1 Tax=Dysgonomonas sp. 25 TaxID=2302933 RepID=UPI0013D6419B|nr:peptidylprolyl isomerase [Dysgonomonas sp. 25]NDV68384.1 hypothetical protein [Dysgonomonas sp. 25]